MPWNKRHTFLWLLLSILITAGLTAVLWTVFGIAGFIGFLFLPFLFYGARFFGGTDDEVGDQAGDAPRRTRRRTCPRCGWEAESEQDRYCPRDAQVLQ